MEIPLHQNPTPDFTDSDIRFHFNFSGYFTTRGEKDV